MAGKYSLKQAHTRSEIDSIMDVIWAANYTPYDPFVQLFFPVLGFSTSDRETSLAESKDRFWASHKSDPTSNWLYVVEKKTGKSVGCAQWQTFGYNPFSEGVPQLRAPWWPEGEHRAFCELILNQVYKPRASWMRRPHLALNWMAVHPSHRQEGVGSLLMQAGVDHADRFNVECWMEATTMGKLLYEKFGFRSLFKIAFDTDKTNASDVWRKCEHEMTPPPAFAMWRPQEGKWEVENAAGKSVTRMPWDLGTQDVLKGDQRGYMEGLIPQKVSNMC